MIPDFHTHAPRPGALVSSTAPELLPAGCFRSLELHPWHLAADAAELPEHWRERAAAADAIGEIGLDRRRGPAPEVQRRVLEQALCVAAELDKPVVLHCVRAVPELLAAVAPYRRMRKLFHGFRGSPELLAELFRHGFFVSFGAAGPARAGTADWLRRTPEVWDRVGVESDDGGAPPEASAARLEEWTGVPWAARLEANFYRFLRGEG